VRWAALGVGACWLASGCDPEVIVGYEPSAGSPGLVASAGSTGQGASAGSPGVVANAGSLGQAASAGSTGEVQPPLPFSAGHEAGNLDEWTADGFGWEYATQGGSLEVSSEQAHSGSRSLKSSISATGELDQAVVGRLAMLTEGYYSAWYFVTAWPELSGRVIMKLSGFDPDESIFDITVTADDSGGLRVLLWEHAVEGGISDPSTVPPIPLDTWFKLEVFYRATSEADGRIVIWQDGEQIIDTGPRATAPNNRVVLIVGTVTRGSDAGPLTVFVDDVQIRAGDPPTGM